MPNGQETKSYEHMASLRTALIGAQSITHLDLSGCGLDDSSVLEVATMMRSMPCLSVISLFNNCFHDEKSLQVRHPTYLAYVAI